MILTATTACYTLLHIWCFVFKIAAAENQDTIQFVYGPAHSRSSVPAYLQIIILHLIALALGIGFFFLRRYLVNRLNSKAVVEPQRRYTVRRDTKATLCSKKGAPLSATKAGKSSTAVSNSSANTASKSNNKSMTQK